MFERAMHSAGRVEKWQIFMIPIDDSLFNKSTSSLLCTQRILGSMPPAFL